MWTKQQIMLHKTAAKHLLDIKDKVFALVKLGVSEYQLQQFVLGEYKKRRMTTTDKPIIAFNASAAIPHYFPKKKSLILKKNTLVLVDLWASMNKPKSPYADITWTGYYGTPSKKILDVFRVVLAARDAALNTARKAMPTGAKVHGAANKVIIDEGYGKYLKHRTGHCIGTCSPHGLWKNINDKNTQLLRKKLGYTIEPGIYINGKFGIRSEIDFFIDKKVVVTTTLQKKLVRLG